MAGQPFAISLATPQALAIRLTYGGPSVKFTCPRPRPGLRRHAVGCGTLAPSAEMLVSSDRRSSSLRRTSRPSIGAEIATLRTANGAPTLLGASAGRTIAHRYLVAPHASGQIRKSSLSLKYKFLKCLPARSNLGFRRVAPQPVSADRG